MTQWQLRIDQYIIPTTKRYAFLENDSRTAGRVAAAARISQLLEPASYTIEYLITFSVDSSIGYIVKVVRLI